MQHYVADPGFKAVESHCPYYNLMTVLKGLDLKSLVELNYHLMRYYFNDYIIKTPTLYCKGH